VVIAATGRLAVTYDCGDWVARRLRWCLVALGGALAALFGGLRVISAIKATGRRSRRLAATGGIGGDWQHWRRDHGDCWQIKATARLRHQVTGGDRAVTAAIKCGRRRHWAVTAASSGDWCDHDCGDCGDQVIKVIKCRRRVTGGDSR
jgi:hypothetical protein